MGSATSSLRSHVAKKMKELLDLAPQEYQNKFNRRASEWLEARSKQRDKILEAICEEIVVDMCNVDIFPEFSPWLRSRLSAHPQTLPQKELDLLLRAAARDCVHMYQAQMSSMTEAQAFAALKAEKWDDFTMWG